MERFIKWLDDLDDLLAVWRAHAPSVMVTLGLLVAFFAVLGAVLVLGPPDLHAAP